MILELKNVSKWYGAHCILDDVTYQITEPKIIALVAPNGTGKTTLLNILTNIEKSDSGSIEILGKSNQDKTIFKDVAYLQDNSVLYEMLTGWTHLTFVAGIHGKSHADILKITDMLEMTHYLKKKVKKYSLGMKQHLLLALALINEPKLLLLDEPLNGLDITSSYHVRQILKKLSEGGTAIILSSHNMEEIDKLTDSILFLYQEELVGIEEVKPIEQEYSLITDNTELLLSYFQKQNILSEQLGEYKLAAILTEQDFDAALQFCQEKQITIFERAATKGLTESIYFNLYISDGDKDDDA